MKGLPINAAVYKMELRRIAFAQQWNTTPEFIESLIIKLIDAAIPLASQMGKDFILRLHEKAMSGDKIDMGWIASNLQDFGLLAEINKRLEGFRHQLEAVKKSNQPQEVQQKLIKDLEQSIKAIERSKREREKRLL